MSVITGEEPDAIMRVNEAGRIVVQPLHPAVSQNKQAGCDKNSEIEKIKRLMFNLIDRVDALKDK